jgi:hypothetical protein
MIKSRLLKYYISRPDPQSLRKEEGLPPKKAILATAHKLLRVLFAMLTSKSYFRKGVVEV